MRQKPGRARLRFWREQRGEAGAGPFEVGIVEADGEGHVAGDGVHPELAEQRGEVADRCGG